MIEKKKRVFLITGILVNAFILIYVSGTVYYKSHFFANTLINGVDYSNKSKNDVTQSIEENIQKYKLRIKGRDGLDFEIQGKNIDLLFNEQDEIIEILSAQKNYRWPIEIIKANEYCVTQQVEYSREKLYEILGKIDAFDRNKMIPPQNAEIGEYNSEKKKYEVIPAVNGNYIIRYKTYRKIENAINQLEEEIDLDENNCYRNALIKENSKSIQELLSQLDTFTSTEIVYIFGRDEVKIDGDVVNQWIYIDNDQVKISEIDVANFIKELSKKYDTAFRKHKFITVKGEEIIIDKGHYGWWMDRNEETKELIQMIQKGEKTFRKPRYFQEAAEYGEYDYGNTYVELDLTKQHLYLWKEGHIILESDFVSGNVANGNSTPEGIFPITYKEKNATLRGDDYENAVSFWMPFNGNIGMHDAPWRKRFGEEIYKTNGSHGCINLPVDIAGQIFEQVYTGMPVVCYYSKDEQ